MWRDSGTLGMPGGPAMAAGRRVSGPFLLGSRSEEGSDACRESASLGGGLPRMDSSPVRRAQGRSRARGWWGRVAERDPAACAGHTAPPPTAPATRWVWLPRRPAKSSRTQGPDSTRARQSRLGRNTQRNDAPAPPWCPTPPHLSWPRCSLCPPPGRPAPAPSRPTTWPRSIPELLAQTSSWAPTAAP